LDSTPSSDLVNREPRSEIRLFDVVAIFFLAEFVTGLLGYELGTAVGGDYAINIGGIVGIWVGIIPAAIFVCRKRATGNLVRDVGLRFQFPADLIGIPVGLGSQFLLLPIVYAVIQTVLHRDLTKELEQPAHDLTNNAHGPGFWVLAVLLIVGAPLVEEIFYRGMLLPSLKRYLPPIPSILVCGLIFGAAHFDLVTLPGLALFGAVLAWLAHRSGRLGPNVIAHAAFNAATVAILWHG
jgi:membrane protease YdiL (CAAX protease family)